MSTIQNAKNKDHEQQKPLTAEEAHRLEQRIITEFDKWWDRSMPSDNMSKSDASRIQSSQATGGKDMSSGGFAARAQSAGDRNTIAAAGNAGQTSAGGGGAGQAGGAQGGNKSGGK